MVVLNERKKTNKINALKMSDPIKKSFISLLILSDTRVRINGKPLIWVAIFVSVSNAFTASLMSYTILVRLGELSASLLIRTPIK